ncbi:MAG: hypothetical protein LBI53_03000 [Candidatus Peribacteria bacterium]|jgi:hypothetical protein|nr:hypothetical protein [Candidatus Peribacteria bacterium]
MIYPENYILSFQAGGLTPLMTDICREAFADLKALFIVENGWMKQYLRNDVVTEAGKEGIEFFNNDEKIITYINQMKSLIANFQEFYSHKIIKKNEISREDCKIFLHLVVELNKLYAITNYERSDKAFLEKENKPNITKNLEIISKYRDEARIFLNKVCFESGGYMDTVCNLLSQQFDLSRQEVNSYTQKELLKLYQGKKLKNLILYQREKIFVVDSTNEKYYR